MVAVICNMLKLPFECFHIFLKLQIDINPGTVLAVSVVRNHNLWRKKMTLVEEIKLRTAVNKETDVHQYLTDIIEGIKQENGLIEAKIYDHAHLENDFSIQLVWDTETLHFPGSEEGKFLKHNLQRFGLVSYSVWLEKM
jgi:hypothetical protein